MSIIKSLLAVRKSTCNDTCLLEANFPSLKSYVTQRKKSFFQKKWPLIQEGDPLNRAMELVKQKNTTSYQVIEKLLNDTSNIITGERENLKEKVLNRNTPKTIRYCKLNPLLKFPNIYNSATIKEYQRITFKISSILSILKLKLVDGTGFPESRGYAHVILIKFSQTNMQQ